MKIITLRWAASICLPPLKSALTRDHLGYLHIEFSWRRFRRQCMWDSIWHLRGSTPIADTDTTDVVLDSIEIFLGQQQKYPLRRASNAISFKSSIWGFQNRNLAMVIYDEGTFWIENRGAGRILKYDLKSLSGFIFCLAAAVAFFVFVLATGQGISSGLKIATFTFCWLYGMNMLLAWLRIPRAIREAVNKN